MADIPNTMSAWTVVRPGEPQDVLELKTAWPTPLPPGVGEIMVRVSYAALNPGDLKMMSMKIPFKGTIIPGMDFVGEVVQLGPSVPSTPTNLRTGMIVAGTMSMMQVWRGVGVLAEYLVLPAHLVVQKPDGLDELVASGLLGVAGQTSYVLTQTANLREGDKALVNGASGGVGSILVQALRGIGVHVTAICSAKNEIMLRRLGADEVVDYTAHSSLSDRLSNLCKMPDRRPFDAVFDCVGNDTLFHRSPGYLQPTGRFLSIEAGPFGFLKFMNWPRILGGISQTYMSVFSTPSGESAKGVAAWFKSGFIKEVPIDSIFEMEDVLQAFQKLATQRAAGKILVRVKRN